MKKLLAFLLVATLIYIPLLLAYLPGYLMSDAPSVTLSEENDDTMTIMSTNVR